MACGHGYGKIILFGEHFVVYGLPAIVSAIYHKAEIVVERKKTLPHKLIDNCIKFPGVPPLTWELCQKPISALLHQLGISTPLCITLQGNLPVPHTGIGSSAAHLVGLAQALNKEFNLHLNQEAINQAAYVGEKEIHGNPSGIDNTVATYGGMFLFTKQQPLSISTINLTQQVEVVLADSGKGTKTSLVVEAVRQRKQQEPTIIANIFNKYSKLVTKAHAAFLAQDFYQVGSLMNQNHKLLQELGVSSPELDDMVATAREAGALGAKVTGTGRGGLMVALTPTKELQEKVAFALGVKEYPVLKTLIG